MVFTSRFLPQITRAVGKRSIASSAFPRTNEKFLLNANKPKVSGHSYSASLKSLQKASLFTPAIKAAFPLEERIPPPIMLERAKEIQEKFEPYEAAIRELVREMTPLERACLEIIRLDPISWGAVGDEPSRLAPFVSNVMACEIHGVKDISQLPRHAGPISYCGEGGQAEWTDGTYYQDRGRQESTNRYGGDARYLNGGKKNTTSVIEEKANQGAKPGEGGEVLAHKVDEVIAYIRRVEAFTKLASLSIHLDMLSIEENRALRELFGSVNPNAANGIKFVAHAGIGTEAAGSVKNNLDKGGGYHYINIQGPGGTGSTKAASRVGYAWPWEMGAAEVHQTLEQQGLRKFVWLTASGGIMTPRDIFIGILLGLNGAGLGTAAMKAGSCVAADVCHDGTCPVNYAVTDVDKIRAGFKGTPLDLARYLATLAKGVAQYLQDYGFNHPSQAVGQGYRLLKIKPDAPMTGLEKLIEKPINPLLPYTIRPQPSPGPCDSDKEIVMRIMNGETHMRVSVDPAKSKAVGGYVAHMNVTSEEFQNALVQPVHVIANGTPGHSFGSYLPPGVTLSCKNANEFAGKDIDGGKLWINGSAGTATGYAAKSGWIYVRHADSRTGAVNCGATIAAKYVGYSAGMCMATGNMILWGKPEYYGLDLVDKDEFDIEGHSQPMTGPNFLTGATGGTVILPKKGFEELLKRGYIANSGKDFTIKPVAGDEKAEKVLKYNLKEYATALQDPLTQAILGKTNYVDDFVVLRPK